MRKSLMFGLLALTSTLLASCSQTAAPAAPASALSLSDFLGIDPLCVRAPDWDPTKDPLNATAAFAPTTISVDTTYPPFAPNANVQVKLNKPTTNVWSIRITLTVPAGLNTSWVTNTVNKEGLIPLKVTAAPGTPTGDYQIKLAYQDSFGTHPCAPTPLTVRVTRSGGLSTTPVDGPAAQ